MTRKIITTSFKTEENAEVCAGTAKKETAKKLKEKNVSLDIIQECTGLEPQEIAML